MNRYCAAQASVLGGEESSKQDGKEDEEENDEVEGREEKDGVDGGVVLAKGEEEKYEDEDKEKEREAWRGWKGGSRTGYPTKKIFRY